MSRTHIATIRHDMFEVELFSYKALAQALRTIHASDSAIASQFEASYNLPPINATTPFLSGLQCYGINRNSTDGRNHSTECQAQHDLTVAKAVLGEGPTADSACASLGEGPALETSEDCAIHAMQQTLENKQQILGIEEQINLLIEARENLKVFNMTTEAVDKLLTMHGVTIFDHERFPPINPDAINHQGSGSSASMSARRGRVSSRIRPIPFSILLSKLCQASGTWAKSSR